MVSPASIAASSKRDVSSRTSASRRTFSWSSLPDSSRERSSRSATIRERRTASRSSCSANRGTAAGSSCHTCKSVSAAAWIDAAGVFSSCDAFATKSRRTASRRRASVTSAITARTEPSVPAGVAVTRSQRVGAPVSMSATSTPPGVRRPADGLADARWVDLSERFGARAEMMLESLVREDGPRVAIEQQDPVVHGREDLVADLLAPGPRPGCALRDPSSAVRCLGLDASGRRGAASHRPTNTPTMSPTPTPPAIVAASMRRSVGRAPTAFIFPLLTVPFDFTGAVSCPRPAGSRPGWPALSFT